MKIKENPGLGELLRHVGELVELGAAAHYREMGLDYRTRYTPVLRALRGGAGTITEITGRTRLTQGAVSQTVGLLEADGLVERHPLADGRKSGIGLTPAGRKLVGKLERHWSATFAAIAALEEEIGHPLRQILVDTAEALERRGFSERLASAKQELTAGPRHAE